MDGGYNWPRENLWSTKMRLFQRYTCQHWVAWKLCVPWLAMYYNFKNMDYVAWGSLGGIFSFEGYSPKISPTTLFVCPLLGDTFLSCQCGGG